MYIGHETNYFETFCSMCYLYLSTSQSYRHFTFISMFWDKCQVSVNLRCWYFQFTFDTFWLHFDIYFGPRECSRPLFERYLQMKGKLYNLSWKWIRNILWDIHYGKTWYVIVRHFTVSVRYESYQGKSHVDFVFL